MEQPGLNGRHRNRDGEISRKHGNTRVSTLRRIYGESFAQGFSGHDTLAEVLAESGERSLSQFHRDQLHNDHEAGRLEAKIAEHSAADDSLAKSVAEDQAKIDRGAP